MKSTFKKIVCLLLAMALVFSLVACGEKETTSTVDDDWAIEFDAGEETADGTEADGTANGAANGAANGGTANGATANGGNSGGTGVATSGSADNATTALTQNLDSLSWKELLSQMPKSLRGSTIKVASWNPIKDVTGAQKVIDNFTKETGIKVAWEEIAWDNYETTVAAYVNAGKSPDIIRYQYPTAAKMSVTQDLKTATGCDFSGDIWDKPTRDVFTINGKVYGINLKNTFNMQPQVVYYSAKNIKNNKMEDPYKLWINGQWTYTKFKEMCLEYLEKTNSSAAWMTSYQTDYLNWLGLDVVSFDGKQYKSNLSDIRILTGIQEMCNNYSQKISASAMRMWDKLEDNTYLFYSANIIAARRTDFHFTTIKSNGDLRCVPAPTVEGQKNYVFMQESEAYGVPKGAKNTAAVYYYLRYYLNADNYDADMFFANDQTLDVYKWSVAQENKLFFCGDVFGIDDYIKNGNSAAQAKKHLDSIAPTVDAYVKEANNIIAKF